jgi:hypothetical protein
VRFGAYKKALLFEGAVSQRLRVLAAKIASLQWSFGIITADTLSRLRLLLPQRVRFWGGVLRLPLTQHLLPAVTSFFLKEEDLVRFGGQKKLSSLRELSRRD